VKQYRDIAVTIDGDVCFVKLNREAKLNAITRRMLSELCELCDHLENRTEIRFLVLHSEARVFSAGADLDDLVSDMKSNGAKDKFRSMQRLAQRTLSRLMNLEQITFAALNGKAIGAGFAIASVMDFRIMEPDAKIVIPEVERGLYLSFAMTPRLVSQIGLSKAKEMILIKRSNSASEAEELGLVNAVAPTGKSRDVVNSWISEIRKFDSDAVRITKSLANAAHTPHIGDVSMGEAELTGFVVPSSSAQGQLLEFLND